MIGGTERYAKFPPPGARTWVSAAVERAVEQILHAHARCAVVGRNFKLSSSARSGERASIWVAVWQTPLSCRSALCLVGRVSRKPSIYLNIGRKVKEGKFHSRWPYAPRWLHFHIANLQSRITPRPLDRKGAAKKQLAHWVTLKDHKCHKFAMFTNVLLP